jgi:hypothetical protein
MQWNFTNSIDVGITCGSGVRTGSGGCWHRWQPQGSRRRS